MRKAFIYLLVLIGGITLYNVDAIYGSWKFDKLCKTEGGPRLLGLVEPNKGWLIEPGNSADFDSPFWIGQIDFVRYTNESGKRLDVRLDGPRGLYDRKFIKSEVDESKPVKYAFSYELEVFKDDRRFKRRHYKVTDLETGRILATYTIFIYSWTTPERTLLAAPTASSCWSGEEYSRFIKNIYVSGAKK